MDILPLYPNRRGNFHGHFGFVSKPTWKFPWPFCLCIKSDVEISVAILPLYQNRRGNCHGHFAFVSKTDMEISMAIFPLYHKLMLEISMAIFHFIFVDGGQHILKKTFFAISCKTKKKFGKKYPLLAKNCKPTFEFGKIYFFYEIFLHTTRRLTQILQKYHKSATFLPELGYFRIRRKVLERVSSILIYKGLTVCESSWLTRSG